MREGKLDPLCSRNQVVFDPFFMENGGAATCVPLPAPAIEATAKGVFQC